MKILSNKIGFIAAIMAITALLLNLYSSYSEAMNDGVYDTPSYFIGVVNFLTLNQEASKSPEMKAVLFPLFDDNKRILFFYASILFIVVSTFLCLKSYKKKEHSLYYSSAILFSLSSLAIISNILFFVYFFIVLGFAYYDKYQKFKKR